MSKRKVADWLEERYEISDAQAFRIIRDALKDLQDSTKDFDTSDIKAEYCERLNSWIETAVKEKDMKTAMKCQDMLNKINQLYIEKQDINITSDTIKFTFDS